MKIHEEEARRLEAVDGAQEDAELDRYALVNQLDRGAKRFVPCASGVPKR